MARAANQNQESTDGTTNAYVAPSNAPARAAEGRTRPFPAASYKEAAELAEALVEISGGADEVRRITLFDHLKRSPESGSSRQAVTNSPRYGLTEGGYKAETLKRRS
jgi:hypothetical protein